MDEKPFKALETPRSAVALALVAIVLGVGSTMMPPSFWPYLLGLFYLLAATTAWLCRTEIEGAYRKLRRSEISQIPKDFWFVMVCVVVELAVPTSILMFKANEDDVRASFFIEGNLPNLSVRAEITDPGKYGAVITSLNLFEIVALHPKREANENADLCDEVSPNQLPVIRMGMMMMGEGAQVGGAERQQSFYQAKRVTLDGVQLEPKKPVPLESGKIQEIQADFELRPDHWKNFDTVVVCPMIGIRDVHGNNSISICKGASYSYGLNSQLGMSSVLTNSWQQRRLLPHSEKLPSCPPS